MRTNKGGSEKMYMNKSKDYYRILDNNNRLLLHLGRPEKIYEKVCIANLVKAQHPALYIELQIELGTIKKE